MNRTLLTLIIAILNLSRANLDTLIGVLVENLASQGTMIQAGILRGHRAQVIGDLLYGLHHPTANLASQDMSHQLGVNLASQDIMTLQLGALIHGRSLHGLIHHGQLIG